MPIIEQIDPIVEQPEITPEIHSLDYRDATVDNRFTPIATVLTRIDGAPWPVDFYRCILGADEVPRPYDATQPAYLQSYHEIKGLELRVSTPLTPTGTGDAIEGEAIVYPFIVPNPYDIFIADRGEGIAAAIVVNTVTPLTLYRETCHRITYTLFADVDQAFRTALAAKVTLRSTFRHDFMALGQNPVIDDEALTHYLALESAEHALVTQHLGQALDYQLQTLVVPCDQGTVYDPYYTEAIRQAVDTTETAALRKIRVFDCGGSEADDRLVLWDMLAAQDTALLPLIVPKLFLVPRRYYLGGMVRSGLAFSEVKYGLYPADLPLFGIDLSQIGVPLTATEQVVTETSRSTALKALAGLTDTDEQNDLVYNVDADAYYVFSEAFYFGDRPNMSILEQQVFNLLERKPVDQALILTAIKSLAFWRPLERFYYTLVLLYLVRYARTRY